MAKRTKIDTMDFINSVYGMTASYESSSISYGRKSLNSEYEKPVNAYALAEALSFIKADEYKQMAQTAMVSALGEHAKMIQMMKKKGFSRGEIRSFAESTGFGEVSLDEVKETVVEGAKDAWKSLLALIDKLIEVIKQFVRGIFDKEKQLGTVLRKVNFAKQRVSDDSKEDFNKDIEVAFLREELYDVLGITLDDDKVNDVLNEAVKRSRSQANNVAEDAKKLVRDNLLDVTIESGRQGDVNSIIEYLLIIPVFSGNRAGIENIIRQVTYLPLVLQAMASHLGIRQYPRIQQFYTYQFDNNGNATKNSRPGSANNTQRQLSSLTNMDVSKYKADWGLTIDLLKDVMKEIKDTKRTEKGTIRRQADIKNLEGLNISISRIPRGPRGIEKLNLVLNQTELTLKTMQKNRFNKRLEHEIKYLGDLKRDLIKNKDNKYSTKYAQLGRVAIQKYTQFLTMLISFMNMAYSTLFKVAAINAKAAISVTSKDDGDRSDWE